MTDTEIQIVTADLREIPLESFDGFDTMLVDPPYSPHVHENMASHGTGGRGSVERDPGFSALSPELRGRISEIASRMRRWSVIFSDLQGAHYWDICAHSTIEPVRWVPWIRWSQPQLSGDRPPSGAEMLCHYHPAGAKHWNGPGNLTHYSRRCLRGADKHPTEKPLDLMLDLVSWFSDPGENVVDVCSGSGTTALACKLLGRSCLAVELDPRWLEVATARQANDWVRDLVHLVSGVASRDRARALEWCDTTETEASAHLAKPAAASGEDQNTRRRAEARIADVSRVRAWL